MSLEMEAPWWDVGETLEGLPGMTPDSAGYTLAWDSLLGQLSHPEPVARFAALRHAARATQHLRASLAGPTVRAATARALQEVVTTDEDDRCRQEPPLPRTTPFPARNTAPHVPPCFPTRSLVSSYPLPCPGIPVPFVVFPIPHKASPAVNSLAAWWVWYRSAAHSAAGVRGKGLFSLGGLVGRHTQGGRAEGVIPRHTPGLSLRRLIASAAREWPPAR